MSYIKKLQKEIVYYQELNNEVIDNYQDERESKKYILDKYIKLQKSYNDLSDSYDELNDKYNRMLDYVQMLRDINSSFRERLMEEEF